MEFSIVHNVTHAVKVDCGVDCMGSAKHLRCTNQVSSVPDANFVMQRDIAANK